MTAPRLSTFSPPPDPRVAAGFGCETDTAFPERPGRHVWAAVWALVLRLEVGSILFA